ncbi:hypothetical protein [Fictibacillus sp. FJAT-27399]|uniref:hypothetical protein n=1 Tax=Fictibacillus sp. FJAT-27399 TaxID=1729689 RepID=UPI000782BF0A|nr:hypothetical protein [Fictibacillus sp. FJAT-27399]
MDKKKALKIATATTVAASAFVSVAPATFAASTSTASKAVTKAEADAKKVKDLYNAKKLSFKKISYKTATASYNKAVAEVKKLAKGKTKTALENRLKSVKSIHTYAANYNKAIDLSAALATATSNVNAELKKASFDLAGAKKDQAALKTATANFSKHVVKGTVYGESPRAQFTAKYLTPAKTAATAVDKKIKAVEAELSDVKIATADVTALESAVKGLKDEATVATAEKLLTAAKASFAKVDTASVKADLSKRISAAEKTLGDFKTEWNEVKTATADVVKLEEAVKALKDDATVKAAEDALATAKASYAKVDTETVKADLGKRIEDAGKGIEAKKAELAVPKVESVSAINASQIVVKFNKLVDETTAGDKANYTVEGSHPASVEVQEDEKSVVLTLAAPYAEAKTVAAQVEGVKLKDSQDKFPLFAGTVTIEDKVAANISSVAGTTNGDVLKSVKVSYSEPVKAGAAIKIDGVKVAVTSAGVSQDISGLSLDASKEHTVEIVNLTDGANNVAPVVSYKFSATKDVSAPTVKSVSALNDNQFVVEFSEKVDKATVETTDFAVVKTASLSPVSVTGVAPVSDDVTGTKYVVTTNLASADYSLVNSIALNIAIRDKAFKDVPGNESAASTASVTLTKDAVAPTLASTVFEKDNDGAVTKVTLKFDEEVNLGAGMDYTDLEVVQDNGVLQSGFFTKSEVDGKNVVLTVKSGVKAGKFSVSLPTGFVVDKSIAGNKSVASSSIVDFGKGETATTFVVSSAKVLKSNEITVTYPTKVVGGAFDGSATSLDRYTLNGKMLPEGTKITLDAGQTVATIVLPAGSISSTDAAAVFQVNGVKALTGETSKLFTETITITDNVAPVLTSAQVLADGQTFVFNYSENLGTVGATLGSEFKFVVDGKEVTLADGEFTKVSASGKQIVAKVNATVSNNDAKPASAAVSGTNASIATVANGDKATQDKVYTYTVGLGVVGGANEGQPVVTDGTTEYALSNGDATFKVDNVDVSVKGAKDGDTFTVTTKKAVAATTSALAFNTSKVITVETVAPTLDAASFDIEDLVGNDQKAEVKLTTTR